MPAMYRIESDPRNIVRTDQMDMPTPVPTFLRDNPTLTEMWNVHAAMRDIRLLQTRTALTTQEAVIHDELSATRGALAIDLLQQYNRGELPRGVTMSLLSHPLQEGTYHAFSRATIAIRFDQKAPTIKIPMQTMRKEGVVDTAEQLYTMLSDIPSQQSEPDNLFATQTFFELKEISTAIRDTQGEERVALQGLKLGLLVNRVLPLVAYLGGTDARITIGKVTKRINDGDPKEYTRVILTDSKRELVEDFPMPDEYLTQPELAEQYRDYLRRHGYAFDRTKKHTIT